MGVNTQPKTQEGVGSEPRLHRIGHLTWLKHSTSQLAASQDGAGIFSNAEHSIVKGGD